jgi:DNA-binding transcriptional LysR family regulator
MARRTTSRPALSWDDLRVFLAISRRGSQATAAVLLGIDATTVGRRLTALEKTFGARLFDRTPQGLVATDAGRSLVARAERAEAEILAAERELGGADARLEGPVRVTASDGVMNYVILPRLDELRRAHPGVTLEVRGDSRNLDLSRREADVAVRVGRPKEPSLVARKVAMMGFGLYATRAYLERRPAPRTLADLAHHDHVGFEASFDHLPHYRWLRKHVRDPRFAIRASTTTAQVGACRASQGIAILGSYIGRLEPNLVRILARAELPTSEVWIAVHEDVRPNARVAAVVEWLTGAVQTIVP